MVIAIVSWIFAMVLTMCRITNDIEMSGRANSGQILSVTGGSGLMGIIIITGEEMKLL